MDAMVFQAVFLFMAVCFGLTQSRDRQVFQPKIRSVSMTKHFHHLQMEWDVTGDFKPYGLENEIVFNIQVNKTEENQRESKVFDENYLVPLSKLNKPLVWNWAPLVPLQCEPHVVRIRSQMVDKSVHHSEPWSNWSPWAAVSGLETMDDDNNYLFPYMPTVKAGSNVTFCCIAKKTGTVQNFRSFDSDNYTDGKHRKMFFYLRNASQDSPNVICIFSEGYPSGTRINVIEVPNKPEDFSCKTQEKKHVTCSWKTKKSKDFYFEDSMCPTEFILSDVSNTTTYYNTYLKKDEYNCSFTIEEEPVTMFRLTAKNCFGENHVVTSTAEPEKELSLVIILLLGIISLLLIMCICFCAIYCIRNRYFATIPHPDVTPFLKQNSGTLKICDVAPDELEVMENHNTCTGKQAGLGVLIIENIAYFDPAYRLNLQEREAESKNLIPPSTSYKPLQDVFSASPFCTSYKPLQDFFANKSISQLPHQDQGNFSYTSGMKVPDCVVQLEDLSGLVEDMHPADYKPQQATKLETNPPDSDNYVHLRNTYSWEPDN